jgi:hypothetical protein
MNLQPETNMRMAVAKLCRGRAVMVCLAIWITASGCRPTNIDAVYGRRRGNPGSESVNGTAVLAELFELADHRVVTWRRLSPKLDQFQTIVWFPDDFAAPTQEQRKFLEKWLVDRAGRTLIYVGRDYNAAIAYWQKVQPQAPANQALEVARRLATVQAVHDRDRAEMPQRETCDWFTMRRDAMRQTAGKLSGPWAAGVDGSKCDMELNGRLEIPNEKEKKQWLDRLDEGPLRQPPKYEKLLACDGELAAGRITLTNWNTSQLIFVANGSFLLNLPLVNHEHRKIANHLIVSCGNPGKVAFLESGKGGPPVYDKEPGANSPTGFEVFTVWPLGVILVHLTALGILACVSLFPVFGRPRELTARTSSDFGQHIEALGELLEKTGDREYAVQRLQTYHEHVRREPPVKKKGK